MWANTLWSLWLFSHEWRSYGEIGGAKPKPCSITFPNPPIVWSSVVLPLWIMSECEKVHIKRYEALQKGRPSRSGHKSIGDFRVAFHICFKASPSAKPFILKLVLFKCKVWFIYIWIILIFKWKASHQDSLRNRGERQLGNRLLACIVILDCRAWSHNGCSNLFPTKIQIKP